MNLRDREGEGEREREGGGGGGGVRDGLVRPHDSSPEYIIQAKRYQKGLDPKIDISKF